MFVLTIISNLSYGYTIFMLTHSVHYYVTVHYNIISYTNIYTDPSCFTDMYCSLLGNIITQVSMSNVFSRGARVRLYPTIQGPGRFVKGKWITLATL